MAKKEKENKQGWTRHFRDDKDIWEDTCPHGVGHEPGVHGCDGCCFGMYKRDECKHKNIESNMVPLQCVDCGYIFPPENLKEKDEENCASVGYPKSTEEILVKILAEIHLLNTIQDPICRVGYDEAKREIRHIIKEYILKNDLP